MTSIFEAYGNVYRVAMMHIERPGRPAGKRREQPKPLKDRV